MRDFPPPPFYQEGIGRAPESEIDRLQNERFLQRVAEAWSIPFYQRRWSAVGLERGDIRSLEDIEKIPVFSTDDLREAAAEAPPFGNHHPIDCTGFGKFPLKMQTSGGTTGLPRVTLFDPIAWEVQGVLAARALYSQGARPGDVIQIPYTQGLANAGWSGYTGIFNWLGAVPVTTGSGVVTPSERQLEYAQHFQVNGWFIASEYLDRLTDVARQIGFDLRRLPTRYLHTFLGPDHEGRLRQKLQDAWGAPVFDSYGSHEVGQIAFECQHHGFTKHICEDVAIVEIVNTSTGARLANGEAGNLVVTSLHRSMPPFIRYNIRDVMSLHDRSACECGLVSRRLSMLHGRSDEMVKLRGTNVYPLACQEVIANDARTTDTFQCVAYWLENGGARREEMAVRVERTSLAVDGDELARALARQFHKILTVRVAVEVFERGQLEEATRGAHAGKPRRLIDLRKSATPYESISCIARAS